MNSGDGTARVCARVNEVLKALPTPTSASREEIFEQRNLWSEEIQSTCHQVIEYYKSILILVGQELYRPAASLSRSIHEAEKIALLVLVTAGLRKVILAWMCSVTGFSVHTVD